MKYFVGALIGAVIGYMTNWLAIKMLFRPYEEKRILGIKVPFTPGLIPKEQKRIATSVGNAVGEYLLTEEIIVQNLSSDKIQSHIKSSIKRKLNDICESQKTLRESLSLILKDNYERISEFLKIKLVSLINDEIQKPEVQNKLLDILENQIKEILQKNPKEIEQKLNINISSAIREKLTNILKSEDMKAKLQGKITSIIKEFEIENITVRQLISEDIINYIKGYIVNNKAKISSYIQELSKEPWTQEKLRSIVNEAIGNNVNPLISMFINNETIFTKVIGFIDSYLEDEEKQQDIVIILEKIVDHIGDMKLSQILSDEEGVDKVSSALSNIVENDNIIEMISDSLINFVDNDKSISDIVNEIEPNCYSKLREIAKDKINRIVCSSEANSLISNSISKISHDILNLKLQDILSSKKEEVSSVIADMCQNFINEFIHNEGKNIIGILDVSHIVEEEINKFPVDMAEKIIVGIAKNELSAITWLGALLGGIIGILSPVISTLL